MQQPPSNCSSGSDDLSISTLRLVVGLTILQSFLSIRPGASTLVFYFRTYRYHRDASTIATVLIITNMRSIVERVSIAGTQGHMTTLTILLHSSSVALNSDP